VCFFWWCIKEVSLKVSDERNQKTQLVSPLAAMEVEILAEIGTNSGKKEEIASYLAMTTQVIRF
jgi:hypothetical protein